MKKPNRITKAPRFSKKRPRKAGFDATTPHVKGALHNATALPLLEAPTSDKITKTASEVLRAQSSYKDCIYYYLFSVFSDNILNGITKVTSDPVLKQTRVADRSGVTLLHLDLWQELFSRATRFEKNSSEKERKSLDEQDFGRLEGAIIALGWVLGQNDATVETLISDDDLVFEAAPNIH
jgi:hypothetical protein